MDPIIPQPQYQAPMDSAVPSQLPEPKHFLNKKFVITFVILLLLGVGAYVGIWYWQNQQVAQEVVPTFTPRPSTTPDPTADWKTYTNTQYGFEFKYPADWVLQDGKEIGISPMFRSVSITKDLTAEEYLRVSFTSSVERDLALSSEPSYKPKGPPAYLGGTTWTTDSFNDGMPGQEAPHQSLSINTKYDGAFYNITLYPNDGIEIDPMFEEILETFKFVK